MKKTIVVVSCLLAILCATAGNEAGAGERHRPFRDAEYWAGVWDADQRDEWQKPLVLLDLLGIRNGDVVADLGAGTGYMTQRLSVAVGPAGKVYAVDVEQSLLDHLRSREDVVKERVVPILAKPDDPGLPAGETDVVLILNTWHHIKKRPRYLEKLAAALTPEGRVAIVDYRQGELPVGPRPKHKLSRDEVIGEFTEAGWHFVAESYALAYQYVLVFYPPGEPEKPAFLDR